MKIRISTRLWRTVANLQLSLNKVKVQIATILLGPRVLEVRTFSNYGLPGPVFLPNPGSSMNVGNIDLPVDTWPVGATYAVVDFAPSWSVNWVRSATGDSLIASTYLQTAALPIPGTNKTVRTVSGPSTEVFAPNNGTVSYSGNAVYGKYLLYRNDATVAQPTGIRFSVFAGTTGANTNFTTKQLASYRLNGTITFMSGPIPPAI